MIGGETMGWSYLGWLLGGMFRCHMDDGWPC